MPIYQHEQMGTTPEFQARAARVKQRLDDNRYSMADAARGIGYTDESGCVYVRRVLSAMDTSNVILDRIEAWLDAEMQKEAA